MSISVDQTQYKSVQVAIEDILADYGVTGQSEGKLRYLASKALLYTNHHQLESKLRSESSGDDKQVDKQSRLSLDEFRDMAAKLLSRYKLEDLYVCDDCGATAMEDDLPDAENLSMRLGPDSIYTEKECSDCGALSFPLKSRIKGSVIDNLYHDKTLSVSYDHANLFAQNLFEVFSESVDEDSIEELMARARLYYLDLLTQTVVLMCDNRRTQLDMVLAAVNTFISLANDSQEKGCLYDELPEEGKHDDSKGDAETLESLSDLVFNDPPCKDINSATAYISDAELVFFS